MTQKGVDAKLILPEETGFELCKGKFGNRYTTAAIERMRNIDTSILNVVPGYYGTMDGDIAVLSRGGSDTTGGEIAAALRATLYENWTDQDGVRAVDPNIVSDAPVIPELTYSEMRVLSVRGAKVFHSEAMLACEEYGVPICVRNTNNPLHPGTRIMEDRLPYSEVSGISKLDNLAYVVITKRMMDEENGFTEKILNIFSQHNIPTDLYSANVDELAIFMPQDKVMTHTRTTENKAQVYLDTVTKQIRQASKPKNITWGNDISIITMVGKGMKNSPGVIARCATSLANNGINIVSNGMAISDAQLYFGVRQAQSERAIVGLYETFIRPGMYKS